MPEVTQPLGLPYVTAGDHPRLYPPVMQDLAEATQAALSKKNPQVMRWYARGSEAPGGPGVYVPLTQTLAIPSAQAGMYLIGATAVCKNYSSSDTYGLFTFRLSGSRSQQWIEEADSRFWRTIALHTLHAHMGGDLTVEWAVSFSGGAGVLVGAASDSWVVRVSD